MDDRTYSLAWSTARYNYHRLKTLGVCPLWTVGCLGANGRVLEAWLIGVRAMLPSSGTPQEAIARKQKLDDDFVEAEQKVMRMLRLGAAITRNLVLDETVFMNENLALRTRSEVAQQLTEYFELIQGVRSMLRRLEPRLTNLEFRRAIVPDILKEQFEQSMTDCQQKIDDLFHCLNAEPTGYPSFVATDTMSADETLTSRAAVSATQTASANALQESS